MGYEYVRFQRGKQSAYDALKNAGRLDRNTLYFIYDDDNPNIGALYMGYSIISGGDITIASATLDDLADVIITETGVNSFLIKEEDQWVSKSLEDVVALIEAQLDIDPTVSENISNLQNSLNDLTKDFEDLESSIADKADKNTVDAALEGKADKDTVDAALANKANASEVESALNNKVDITTFNEALSSKADASEVTAALGTINTNLDKKANADDVYTIEEVDSKITSEIESAIINANHLKREIVNSLDAIDTSADGVENIVYMVLAPDQTNNDNYDEYMVINGSLEKVGSWGVNLNEYAKTADVNTALEGKVDKVEGSRLITAEEAKKLGALVEVDGEIAISGTVGAAKVQELYDNVVRIVTGTGTAEYDGAQKVLLGIEAGAQVNKIETVDTNNFVINNKQVQIIPGKLLMTEEQSNKLSGIEAGAQKNVINSVDSNHFIITDGKISLAKDYVTTTIYHQEIGDLSQLLRESGRENSTLVDEINYINERLTWSAIPTI